MKWDLALRRLSEGVQLAAPVAAEHEGAFAWVAVSPLNLAGAETRPVLRRLRISVLPGVGPVFHVRVIEVSAALLTEDRWLCEDDLCSREEQIVVGEEALRRLLERLGVQGDGLEHPNEVDYPI